MNLSELQMGESAIILKVKGRGAFRKRILEMGFVSGKTVTAIKSAPLRDPVEYTIMGYNVSLRKNEAQLIEISKCESDAKSCAYEGLHLSGNIKKGNRPADKIINIALVGNPNCGKTTIFNNLSGSHEKVGNYSGVTVEAKESSFDYKDYTFNLTDLPGTYSITAYTPEELYVRSQIIDALPDLVINVIDASNLERNLYLTTQLIDMDIKVIIALNMFDELTHRGDVFDYKTLGEMMGIPFVPTIGSKGTGLLELLDKAIEVYEDKDPSVRHIHINYGADIEDSIRSVQKEIRIPENYQLTDSVSSRFLSIKLLEKDADARARIADGVNPEDIMKAVHHSISKMEDSFKEDSETIITDAKYGFIAGALRETYTPGQLLRRRTTEIIDAILTSRVFGFPIFLIFMWLMFQGTFSIGKYPMEWIDSGVQLLSTFISGAMPDGTLKALIIDGIIGGVGGVIVFLPNILILFFFISLMEDTGYMARAAFIMDKIMHKIGLHGKSFIPLIMGFGCNVPAIMATRTIESRNDRLVTILISPFMSCSARLPVYVLFIGAFFTSNPGTILFALYTLGIAIAALSAVLLKKTFFRSKDIPFVMELPPYRMPTAKSVVSHMWEKGVQYLKKMGGVILVASIIIWALGHFPTKTEFSHDYTAMYKAVDEQMTDQATAVENGTTPVSLSQIENLKEKKYKEIALMQESERQEKSYIGRIGKAIEPLIQPLGFDWRIGISIITGLAAKEIVVSSMGVLFNADTESDETSAALKDKLLSQTISSGPRTGEKLFTPLVAFSFMVFVLLYFPCIATVIAMKNETGGWKWPVFSIFYSIGMAWIFSFIIYQAGKILF